jgi:hypothetical protein
MSNEQEARRGRPLYGLEPAKNRTIRLDDRRWRIFKERLGLEWLRQKIDEEDRLQPPTKTTKE